MYYVSNKLKRIKSRFILIIIFVTTIFLADIILFEIVIFPSVSAYVSSTVETKLLNIMNAAAEYVLSNTDVTYDMLAVITKNSDDAISTLEVDTIALNKLKADIANYASQCADKCEDITVSIPIGTLSGLINFSGYGPSVSFKVKSTSSVFTDYKSDFSSAGINQTLHRIIISVRCVYQFILPLHRKSGEVTADYIIAQSVIVGDVPDNYTVVTEVGTSTDDTVGNIFDYGTVGD